MQTPHKTKTKVRKPQQFQQFNDKCVCQICTCGKHHCPPKCAKFNGQTTNYHDYKPYHITAHKNQVCQYQHKQRHYDPDTMKTSYKKDYQAYQMESKSHQVQSQYRKNNQPFYGQTQYNKSYLPHQVRLERPHTCVQTQHRNKAKFNGITTYDAQFSPKQLEMREPIKPNYQRNNAPFSGQTMYNSQFKPHQIQIKKPSSICQCEPAGSRKNKFMGQSRYNEEFKAYQIQKSHICPIQKMPVYPRCSPNKNHVNYSSEKHKWQ